jgi:outer membrane lipoprotein-sorting protein
MKRMTTFLIATAMTSLGTGALAQTQTAATTQTQTADQIISKYIDAIGGKERLSQIKTLHTEEEMIIMNNPSPSVTDVVDGKGYKNQVDFNGQQVITCYTDKSGWTVNPLAGQPTPAAVPADQLKIGQMQLDIAGPLVGYSAKGNKVSLTGTEKLGGATVYKLKLTTADNTEMDFFIDTNSFYLSKAIIRLSAGGNPFEVVVVTSNYKKTPFGYTLPFTREVSYPGLTITTEVKKVEINNEIDPSIFVMPKS